MLKLGGKHKSSPKLEDGPENPVAKPELARRREHKKSTIISGRTIGEARERLETKNERTAARKKDKQKRALRIVFTVFGFVALIGILIGLFFLFLDDSDTAPYRVAVDNAYRPTIEIIDEDASATGGKITSRMNEYIGQAEVDLRALGYNPVKAVLPTGTIREVDFYLEGYPGFIKMTIDRGSAVSAEDTDRMLRYLTGQGISEFEYIDVRLDGKAYWK